MIRLIYDNIIFGLQKRGGVSVVFYELIMRLKNNKSIDLKFINNKHLKNNIFGVLLLDLVKDCVILDEVNLSFSRYFNVDVPLKSKHIFHSSYYRISKNPYSINITTVHDFTYEKYASGLRKYVHLFQKYKAIKKSDRIICISENTKKDLLRYVKGVDEKKIHIIYNGVSDDYCPVEKDNCNFPFAMNDYFVFVGSRVNYKKFDFCVDLISKTKYKLVIVGDKLTKNEIGILNNKLGVDNYKIMCNAINSELNIIYNGAFCLFYPSIYEGFGIPVIEAQKAGCPVIAYNGSSIPEIIGNKELLFDMFSIDAVLKKVEHIKNQSNRDRIILDGFRNSLRFNWNNTYDELLKVYEEAWNEK